MKGRCAAVALCALALLPMACSGPRGHRILTFFFDGVPPPGGRAGAEAGLRPGETLAPSGGIMASEHGPYAAKLCDGCHEPGRGNALLVPADQLCGRCHVLALGKKFVHGPLNAGGCLLCHDPHGSSHPFLLVAESGAFCVRCHERRSLRPVEGHGSTDQACTACHEAHMSDRPYLLR